MGSAQVFRLATAQLPVTGDARVNGAAVREAMHEAGGAGARLVHFSEGLLSGYAKNPLRDWAEVDWAAVREELAEVAALAARLRLWVVLGSAHPLPVPQWPHNSLYVVSDRGEVVDRYDKRVLSHTEATGWYTPGSRPVVVQVDGFTFGLLVCVEAHFPDLLAEQARLGVDCVLLSAYPVSPVFDLEARAHAAIHCCWVSLAVPTETAGFVASALHGPDGEVVSRLATASGVLVADLDRDDPRLQVALTMARPWRAGVTARLRGEVPRGRPDR